MRTSSKRPYDGDQHFTTSISKTTKSNLSSQSDDHRREASCSRQLYKEVSTGEDFFSDLLATFLRLIKFRFNYDWSR